MKKVLIVVILVCVLSSLNVYCDILTVPFDCYPKEIQVLFAETDRKLDLDRNERTRDSWGFLINEGQKFTIHTYCPATDDDFTTITDIVWKSKGVYNGDKRL